MQTQYVDCPLILRDKDWPEMSDFLLDLHECFEKLENEIVVFGEKAQLYYKCGNSLNNFLVCVFYDGRIYRTRLMGRRIKPAFFDTFVCVGEMTNSHFRLEIHEKTHIHRTPLKFKRYSCFTNFEDVLDKAHENMNHRCMAYYQIAITQGIKITDRFENNDDNNTITVDTNTMEIWNHAQRLVYSLDDLFVWLLPDKNKSTGNNNYYFICLVDLRNPRRNWYYFSAKSIPGRRFFENDQENQGPIRCRKTAVDGDGRLKLFWANGRVFDVFLSTYTNSMNFRFEAYLDRKVREALAALQRFIVHGQDAIESIFPHCGAQTSQAGEKEKKNNNTSETGTSETGKDKGKKRSEMNWLYWLLGVLFVGLVMFLVGVIVLYFVLWGEDKWDLMNNVFFCNYNKSSQRVLDAYGDYVIKQIHLVRQPFSKFITFLLNVGTLYQFDRLIRESRDNFPYHALIILELQGKNNENKFLLLEKNNCINLSETFLIHNQQEIKTFHCSLPCALSFSDSFCTLNELLEKTKASMGTEQFFNWHVYKNNCQEFIKAIVKNYVELQNERNRARASDKEQQKQKQEDEQGQEQVDKELDKEMVKELDEANHFIVRDKIMGLLIPSDFTMFVGNCVCNIYNGMQKYIFDNITI